MYLGFVPGENPVRQTRVLKPSLYVADATPRLRSFTQEDGMIRRVALYRLARLGLRLAAQVRHRIRGGRAVMGRRQFNQNLRTSGEVP